MARLLVAAHARGSAVGAALCARRLGAPALEAAEGPRDRPNAIPAGVNPPATAPCAGPRLTAPPAASTMAALAAALPRVAPHHRCGPLAPPPARLSYRAARPVSPVEWASALAVETQ